MCTNILENDSSLFSLHMNSLEDLFRYYIPGIHLITDLYKSDLYETL